MRVVSTRLTAPGITLPTSAGASAGCRQAGLFVVTAVG